MSNCLNLLLNVLNIIGQKQAISNHKILDDENVTTFFEKAISGFFVCFLILIECGVTIQTMSDLL